MQKPGQAADQKPSCLWQEDAVTMLGIIGGTSLSHLELFRELKKSTTKTPFGQATIYKGEGYVLVLRHGEDHSIPPHKVNVQANLWAMKKAGVRHVIGISSVGSMRKTRGAGSIVIPNDFLQLTGHITIHDSFKNGLAHIVPQLDKVFRKELIDQLRENDIRIVDGGVYMNTPGPRLETRAEVAMFSKFADVCGMSMAGEATIAQELGLAYANISIVDNMAHGILRQDVTLESIMESVKQNSDKVKNLLETIIKVMV